MNKKDFKFDTYDSKYSKIINSMAKIQEIIWSNIFITKNNGGITVDNLCTVLKRNDLKKSDIYQSDYLDGTAPLYSSYIELKRKIQSVITPK